MVTYIVVTSTQLYNTKMRSSKLILKSNAKNQMVRFDFGRKFQDLKYFELYISCIHYTIKVIVKYLFKKL